jgi:hypothetical protein
MVRPFLSLVQGAVDRYASTAQESRHRLARAICHGGRGPDPDAVEDDEG